jgi:hypothetical protein
MANSTAHTKVTDKGLKNFNKAMEELTQMQAEVGLWGNSREVQMGGKIGPRVVDVAYWNEYGVPKTAEGPGMPSRPFMRRAADTGAEVVFTAALSVARRVIAGNATARTMLNAAAVEFKEHIKRTIREAPSWAVPNAKVTIQRKGHDMPLLRSHLMIATVRHRLKTKGGSNGEL